VIGISYDPVDTLKKFSEKHNISYPLLSDVKSDVIKKYGILNTQIDSGSKNFGIPNPGIYIIDHALIVRNKLFEKSYRNRPSAESVLAVYFNKDIHTHSQKFRTMYLDGSIAISDTLAFPGQILSLVVKISLQKKIHLYLKPIPEGYTALSIDLESNPNFTLDPFQFPNSKQITLESVGEVFNVISNEITLKSFLRVNGRSQLGPDLLKFNIQFQACDDKLCMPPENLNFQFPVEITREIN